MDPNGRLAGLTIVIPTLNAAATLGACLDSLAEATGANIIIVDGGSTDGAQALAEARGLTLLSTPRGRGVQLAAGARRAKGPWLLVLHADTRLAAGWTGAVGAWLQRPDAAERFAVFRFKLDSDAWQARLLEALVDVRVRWLGLPYGDQGLLIHGDLLARVGGFAELPLMEDVDLVRRLGRARLDRLAVDAVTSAERWRRDGWWRRSARNLFCLALYRLGVAPAKIARLYG